MQVTKYPIVVFLTGAFLFNSGCESVDSRIRQHEATFTGLTPAQQERIRTGDIKRGDDADMVWIAFGKPSRRQSITTSSGRLREVWTYVEKRHVKEGAELRKTSSDSGRFAVEETYRVFNVLLREITFLDQRVVHVRDPRRDAQLVAALAP